MISHSNQSEKIQQKNEIFSPFFEIDSGRNQRIGCEIYSTHENSRFFAENLTIDVKFDGKYDEML